MEWTRGHGAFRGLAHPTLARCSQMSAQAGHVDYAGGERATTSILYIAGSKNRLKNRTRSMSQSQSGVPRIVFSGIHISLTDSCAILRWRRMGAACSARSFYPRAGRRLG